MKNTLTLLVVVALLLAAGQAFASDVTKVELSCINGSTVANVKVDGAIRFTHQTEEAKDGKPFRVIVDVMSATHKLGANNFLSLPDCPIKAIRTSQFSVKPEAVVRIVFDMEAEQVYRVENKDGWISVVFADKAARSFAAWSTAGAVSRAKAGKVKPVETQVVSAPAKSDPKSAADLNKSIKKDHLASLEAKQPDKTEPSPVKKTEKKAVAVAKKAPAPKAKLAEDQYGPFVDASLMEPEKPAKAESKPKQIAEVKTEPVEKAPVKEAPVKKVQQPKAPTTQVAQAPAPVKEKTKSATVAKADEAPAKQQPAKKTEQVAKADDKDKSDKKSSTSRFRRSPITSKKIKGTLVAEFPKRLVIKYKAKNHRDPFATLIDESKTNDDPVERQVPNVEGLKLVGVIEAGNKNNRALFEDNEGYGYILQSGDKVQKGYVLRVEADRVYFQIFEYGWSRTVALHLES